MRSAILLILTILALNGTFTGASELGSEQVALTRVEEKSFDFELAPESVNHEHRRLFTSTNHRRNPVSQYRLFSSRNDSFVSGLPLSTLPAVAEQFRNSFSYCVRIGLKLVFPEHYFW